MPGHPVYEAHGEAHSGRVLDNAPHPVGQPGLGGLLRGVGLGQPTGHHGDGILGQGLGIGPSTVLRGHGPQRRDASVGVGGLIA